MIYIQKVDIKSLQNDGNTTQFVVYTLAGYYLALYDKNHIHFLTYVIL